MQTLLERINSQETVKEDKPYCVTRAAPKAPTSLANGIVKMDLVRSEAVACAARYESKRTGRIGIAAFMDDMIVDDPRFFLGQLVKMLPKNVHVDTTSKSFQVIMITDGKADEVAAECLPAATEATESSAESAT